jgi:predicted amidohydrolase YtcJ
MTTWAAKAAFQEKQQGMLKPGMDANFILVDNDIMQCAPDKILGTQVLSTYVNGKKVFKKNK